MTGTAGAAAAAVPPAYDSTRIRTIAVRARIAAPRPRLWQALYPLGDDAAWSGEILSAEPIGEGSNG